MIYTLPELTIINITVDSSIHFYRWSCGLMYMWSYLNYSFIRIRFFFKEDHSDYGNCGLLNKTDYVSIFFQYLSLYLNSQGHSCGSGLRFIGTDPTLFHHLLIKNYLNTISGIISDLFKKKLILTFFRGFF